MVIYDLDVKSIAVLEAKAYAPLIVDANAPLSFAVTAQGFQPIARRGAEVFECVGVIQHLQLALGNIGKCFKPAWAFALKQRLRVSAMECLDHRGSV